jgi:predicted acetyltransferase
MIASSHAEQPSPQVEIIRATREQEAILANLLELYIHDFSEFHPVELGPDGRLGYPGLSLYWSEPDRYPFLVRVDGRLAGLVFVRRGSRISGDKAIWDMAEFFVIRGHRRHGIGIRLAHEIWRLFPGRWEVRVMQSNQAAIQFWQHAVTQFTGEDIAATHFERGGQHWLVFSFESVA